jgi:membrane protein DedA with SNARE-associated domain
MILAGLSDFIVGDLTDWVVDVIDAIGYLGVAFLVALESVFPPIPSEIVLPAAGFAANDGSANVVVMVVAATLGSLVGAWVLYAIAAAVGPLRLRRFTLRHGRWFGVRGRDLDRAESWFDDHSSTAVLVCRCVPLVRSLVSIPAGFRRMDPVRFTVFTILGSLIWNTALVGAGYVLGDNWGRVAEYVDVLQYVVVAAFVVFIGWWVWTRLLSSSHRARRRADAEADRRELERLLAEPR